MRGFIYELYENDKHNCIVIIYIYPLKFIYGGSPINHCLYKYSILSLPTSLCFHRSLVGVLYHQP